MSILSLVLSLFKEMLPLFVNIYIYNKGKNDKEDEIMLKIKDNMIKNLKEQNNVIKKLNEIDNKDYTGDNDNLYDRL